VKKDKTKKIYLPLSLLVSGTNKKGLISIVTDFVYKIAYGLDLISSLLELNLATM
jgi:hypothetical protein